MRVQRILVAVFLVAGVSGWALAQDAPAKAGSGPALTAQPLKAVQTPQTYGSPVSYHRMGANEFTGMQVPGFDTWNDMFYSDGTQMRRYSQVADGWFIGTPHLPSGARVMGLSIQDCVAATDSISGGVYACSAHGSGCTVLAPITTVPGCGYDSIDLSASGYVVDNSPGGNYLVIRIEMTNTDGSDSLAGVNVAYQLQVSPAPAVATFGDVPTSDFGFQYIEALVAAGITGGCGGGNYCPDSPLTRRQMAIFLSIALGLQFP
jgi:hypothetical protein